MAEEREASVQLLKTFAPLDGLKRDNVAALAKKVSVRTMPAGRLLFKEGDSDKRTVWVVAGMVELQEGSRTVAMIRGGTPEARNPLSPQIPRKLTAFEIQAFFTFTLAERQVIEDRRRGPELRLGLALQTGFL